MTVARLSLYAILAVGTVTGLVFALAPELDLRVAGYFFQPDIKTTVSELTPAYNILRDWHSYLTVALLVLAAITLIIRVHSASWPAPMASRLAVLMLVSFALGPGLLVNGILKDHWARPRPNSVFSGDWEFKPWWDPRGACDGNCSFVSGEASSAFWLLAPAAMAPAPWTVPAIAAATAFGAAVGGARIVTGGHFLSDVLFAGVFTALVIWLCHGWIYRWRPTRVTGPQLDDRLARFGAAMRDGLVKLWRMVF
jgi:lipid A 4'-phosphatase